MIDFKRFFKMLMMLLTWLLYLVRKVSTHARNIKPRKVLVLYLSGIGDIICQTEFYKRLKRSYPDGEIWACLPAALVELQDSFFSFDGYIKHTSYKETISQINEQRFDLVILPGWVLKDSILALLSNTKAIIGFINDRSFSNRLVNSFRLEGVGIRVPYLMQNMRYTHLSERSAGIAKVLGFDTMKATEVSIERIAEPQDYVVFHASSQLLSKKWDPANFARVANHLLNNGFCDKIFLIGDKKERVLNEEIVSLAANKKLVNRSGELSLIQSKNLIAAAKLFLGNDSGPMHISALSGVPTLGLLGPYPPDIGRPLGVSSRFIFHSFPCNCCEPNHCGFAYRCMKAITVEEVIGACEDMLKSTGETIS
jgi:ADP-heptose:LPS heptosyltransferase